ncbi:unnamed protein product, partial [Ilex paraguariensis]
LVDPNLTHEGLLQNLLDVSRSLPPTNEPSIAFVETPDLPPTYLKRQQWHGVKTGEMKRKLHYNYYCNYLDSTRDPTIARSSHLPPCRLLLLLPEIRPSARGACLSSLLFP